MADENQNTEDYLEIEGFTLFPADQIESIEWTQLTDVLFVIGEEGIHLDRIYKSINKNVSWVAFFGFKSEYYHDCLDEEIVTREIAGFKVENACEVIVTTWHDDDTMCDTLWEFKNLDFSNGDVVNKIVIVTESMLQKVLEEIPRVKLL